MKKIFLISSALLLVSTFASAETVEVPGGKMEIGDESINITNVMGQVLSLSPGKAVIQTNNPEVPSISQELVDENTVRLGLGDNFMNIQVDPNNPDQIRFLAPDGTVLKTISKTVDANGNETVEVRDGMTNKVTTRATKNADGTKTGTVHETFKDGQSLDMEIRDDELIHARADLNSKNYKKEIRVNNGNMEVLVKDNSNKLLYRLVGNDDYGRIYDASGNLIAEGKGDEDDDMRIYNQAAFDEFERAMDDDDDD